MIESEKIVDKTWITSKKKPRGFYSLCQIKEKETEAQAPHLDSPVLCSHVEHACRKMVVDVCT